MSNIKIRTLVVDDSVFYRGILGELLKNMANVDYVGSAANGSLALSKIEQSPPDLVTLDVEMPGMKGLEVLAEIKRIFPSVHVVMISTTTQESAENTIKALEQGALDFIEKPDEGSQEANERHLMRQLRRILHVVETKIILKRGKVVSGPPATARTATRGELMDRRSPVDIVVIGISTGGPQALPVILEKLPKDFHLPILVVQHLPPSFVKVLVTSLNRRSKLLVEEARNEQALKPGVVYLAPGDYHTKVIRQDKSNTPLTVLTKDPPVNFCRPSVDYMFKSVADIYGGKVLAIIMTGMGKDGLVGLKQFKQLGATTLAQDEASSIVFGMAMEAIKAGAIDKVLPLDDMADFIIKRCALRKAG